MPSTNDIVAKLWNLCHVLRDDGVTYHQYVTELTYLLFLKMADERRLKMRVQVPVGCRWRDLRSKSGIDLYDSYRALLLLLGRASGRVGEIYARASTTIQQPAILEKLVKEIDALDWYVAKWDGLGDLYEGLLERNANEKKSGAGQYFTPRPLIDCMVRVTKPQ